MSLSEPSVRLRFVAAVLCAILALAGCSAEDDTDAEEGAAASEGESPGDPTEAQDVAEPPAQDGPEREEAAGAEVDGLPTTAEECATRGGGSVSLGEITFGGMERSVSAPMIAYAQENGLLEAYGIDLEVVENTNPTTMYQEFVSGRYDVNLGDPIAHAAMAADGVPIRILGGFNANLTWLVGTEDIEWTGPEVLAGRRIAVLQGAGGYLLIRAALRQFHDFDIEEQAETVGAQSPPDALAQVMAGAADVGSSFEVSISNAIVTNPEAGLVPLYNPNADFAEFTDGETPWQTVLSFRDDQGADPATVQCLFLAFQEAAEALNADVDLLDRLAVEHIGVEEGVYREAVESGRYVYDVRPMGEDIATDIRAMLEMRREDDSYQGGEVPESFYEGLTE